MPLAVVAITDPPEVVEAMRVAYERRFVLVRRDGHVAWRSNQLPDNPGEVLDIVRGAAIAATTPVVTEPAAAGDPVYSG